MKLPEMKSLRLCDRCHGSGEVMGVSMRIFCPSCSGHRYVSTVPRQLVSMRDLCEELYQARKQLAAALEVIEREPLSTGPSSAYYGNNGRGVGGSNFTGD